MRGTRRVIKTGNCVTGRKHFTLSVPFFILSFPLSYGFLMFWPCSRSILYLQHTKYSASPSPSNPHQSPSPQWSLSFGTLTIIINLSTSTFLGTNVGQVIWHINLQGCCHVNNSSAFSAPPRHLNPYYSSKNSNYILHMEEESVKVLLWGF